MADELELLFCPSCQCDVLAEAPPCVDGHGAACPDRACVECGTALLLDAPLFELAARRRTPVGRQPASAPRRTHAA